MPPSLTDKESDVLKIERGTKQGDPLSTLLSNTVLQYALEDDLKTRREKSMCISLGDKQADCLSNLRFADDVLLFSTSLKQLKNMMSEFKRCTERVGLKTNPEKKRRFSATKRSNRQAEATVDDIRVELLSLSGKAKYLGQTISFEQQETTETKSRTRAAWASFARLPNNVKIVSRPTSTTFLQLGRRTHDDVRFCHLDVSAGARENDSIDATQDAPAHPSNETKIQKKK